jgi:hypothetical protein
VFQSFFIASVIGLAFPITRDVGDSGDLGDRRAARATALCLRPSATTPPPITALLKTKIKPQFDRTVTERSKPFFRLFRRFNLAQFQPCFFVFAVRSAEGRKVEGVGFLANC